MFSCFISERGEAKAAGHPAAERGELATDRSVKRPLRGTPGRAPPADLVVPGLRRPLAVQVRRRLEAVPRRRVAAAALEGALPRPRPLHDGLAARRPALPDLQVRIKSNNCAQASAVEIIITSWR